MLEKKLQKDIIRAGIMGVCVGDALGVPAEFQSRDELRRYPVRDMIEGDYAAGTWSDDTSMTLCLLASMKEKKGALDCDDIMRRFCRWIDEAYMTANDETFDVGRATLQALQRYEEGLPYGLCGGRDENDCGNGSLMRILPVAFYLLEHPEVELVETVRKVSSLTHAHPACVISCVIYIYIALSIIKKRQKVGLHQIIHGALKVTRAKLLDSSLWKALDTEKKTLFERIFSRKYIGNEDDAYISGSGYVIHTLEASLWCLHHTQSYRTCVLKAVNLGDDADTTAAVAGGLAGLYYGYDDIPVEWLEKIKKREMIEELCND